RAFQVVAHETLQRVAVEADELAEQLGGEHRLAGRFVLGDDLQQDRAGQVLAGLGVADLELLAVEDQLPDVLDGDVARDLGVVETPVRVLLDDSGRAHGAGSGMMMPRSMAHRSTACNRSPPSGRAPATPAACCAAPAGMLQAA